MKPNKHVRKAKGYCCIWCDGPYNKWKKEHKRHQKRTDKRLAIKDAHREVDDYYDEQEGK